MTFNWSSLGMFCVMTLKSRTCCRLEIFSKVARNMAESILIDVMQIKVQTFFEIPSCYPTSSTVSRVWLGSADDSWQEQKWRPCCCYKTLCKVSLPFSWVPWGHPSAWHQTVFSTLFHVVCSWMLHCPTLISCYSHKSSTFL